jgi:hypothetical protein
MISKLGKGALSSYQKQKFELGATKLSLERLVAKFGTLPSLTSLNLRLEEAGKIRNSLFLEHKIQVNIAPVDILAGMPNNLFAHVCRYSELASVEMKLWRRL